MFNTQHTHKPLLLSIGLTTLFVTTAMGAPLVLNDPTQPSGMTVPARQKSTPAAEDVTLKLTAVFSHPQADNSYAVINGKLLKTGQQIAGATILSISPGEVKVRHHGKEKRLTTYKTDIKRHTQAPRKDDSHD